MFYTSPLNFDEGWLGELRRDSDIFMRQLRKSKLSKMDSYSAVFNPETELIQYLIGISYFTELCK